MPPVLVRYLYWLTLAACLVAASATTVVAWLDRDGNLRVWIDIALILIIFPFVVIALLAIWNRQHGIYLVVCLATVAMMGIWVFAFIWSDYQAIRREKPHQGVMHMGTFGALIVGWAGCGIATGIIVIGRLYEKLAAKSIDEPQSPEFGVE